MLILGLKLTHDAAIALIDNNKLIFSIELEKLNNSARCTTFNITIDKVHEILAEYHITYDQIDSIVIDGWGNWDTELGKSNRPYITMDIGNGRFRGEVASYGFLAKGSSILKRFNFENEKLSLKYSSYMHVSGHLMASYSCSPFAKLGQSSFLLVWDGALSPQLFYYHFEKKKFEDFGPIFPIAGNIYVLFASYFEPFKVDKKNIPEEANFAGKVMAYFALGKSNVELFQKFQEVYDRTIKKKKKFSSKDIFIFTEFFTRTIAEYAITMNYKNVDVLATFHFFLEHILIDALTKKLNQLDGTYQRNLCYSGGCALNIKWNSTIRKNVFQNIFVPPFPNDSGSAIGVACCEMAKKTKHIALDWDVYSGPKVKIGKLKSNWICCENFTVKDLGHLLYTISEPVVFLNGAAETGPRALGNRSILASADNIAMKNELNRIKKREDYRPVAPICLEDDATTIFNPGSPDPFMLYDHLVRPEWSKRIPAICHIDSTARLQTVNSAQNKEIYGLLTAYKELSGVPLLCNTSANYNGKGFFPDIQSVIEWGQVNFIWSENKLYVNTSHRPAVEYFNL